MRTRRAAAPSRCGARTTIESLGPRRTGLVVTELPYQVGPERIIEKIKDAVQAKRLTGIADVTDLTDRNHGLRLVIGIKTGFDPQAVLDQLYRLTPLEDSFNINNVALVEGQPQTLGLKELLRVYLDHRIQVVTRRSRYRLARREERLHLVEGLLIAILDIDEVIQVIRTSDDSEQARTRLREVFDLSEVQAEYILELRLRRLTRFSRIELEAERDSLMAEIAQLQELLGSEVLIRAQVARELEAAADAHGTPRRTLLMNAKPAAPRPTRGAPAPDLQIADAPTVVVLSTTGRAVRVDLVDGQELATPARRSKHDAILTTAPATTRGDLGAVTTVGRVIRFSPVDLPSVPPASIQLGAGVVLRDYLGITDKTERILALLRFDDDTPFALGTSQGVVKRIVPSALPVRPDMEVIALKPGRRSRGRGVRAGRRRARVRVERRAAAALRCCFGQTPGRGGGRHGGHQPVGQGHCGVLRQCLRRRSDRSDDLGSRRCAAWHGCRPDQGLEVRGVPRQGPRHGRRALTRLPPGRGPPQPGVGRPGTRSRGRSGRLDSRSSRGERETGCLGPAARRRHRLDRAHTRLTSRGGRVSSGRSVKRAGRR